MSETALHSRRMTLTPAHLIRAGTGIDAVRVQARGYGLIISTLGLRRVRRTLDAVFFHRFRSSRCRALFIGLHGVAWASIALPAPGRLSIPVVEQLHAPALPAVLPLPSLDVHLRVRPPEPP